MKKRYFIRLCIILLAAGLIFAGCDDGLLPARDNAEPLVLTGTSNGRTLTVTISQTDPSRVVLTPKGGEYYEIRLVNELVSKGRISVDGSFWTFTPSPDSPGSKTQFGANYSNNRLSNLSIPGTAISNAQASTNGNQSGNNNNGNNNNDTKLPAINGTVTINNTSPKVGNTLTATYDGNGTGDFTWEWFRGDTVIRKTTTTDDTSRYTVIGADTDETLKVRVSTDEQSGSVTSAPTEEVVDERAALTGIVSLSSTAPKVGDTITATYTGGNGSGAATWQWLRGDDLISGAASATYTVVAADLGTTLRARVSYAGQKSSVPSAATAVVAASDGFVAVSNITDVPGSGAAGTPLALTGTVAPVNATNRSITWAVQNPGTTGANITGGNTLNTTGPGTVTVRAAIANGTAQGSNYAKDFTITINAGSSGVLPDLDIYIVRADSTDTVFKFSVKPVTDAAGYKVFAKSGSEISSSFNSTANTVVISVNAALNNSALTEISVKAVKSSGADASLGAKLPAMVKYPAATETHDAFKDWLQFLYYSLQTLLVSEHPDFQTINVDDLINNVKQLLDDHGDWENNTSAIDEYLGRQKGAWGAATVKILPLYQTIINWLNTGGMEIDSGEAKRFIGILEESSLRLWFNKVFDSSADNGLNNIIKTRIQNQYGEVKTVS